MYLHLCQWPSAKENILLCNAQPLLPASEIIFCLAEWNCKSNWYSKSECVSHPEIFLLSGECKEVQKIIARRGSNTFDEILPIYVRDRYSKPRQYSFACSVKKFHFFIKNNPYLVKASFGQAIAELIEHLSELSTRTKRYIKNDLFKIISFDVDELAVSQIPEKVIRDCMKESYRHILVRGKRFFKFLIHANMLDSKHLPVYTSKMMKFVEQEDDSEGDQANLEQSSTSLKSDCS